MILPQSGNFVEINRGWNYLTDSPNGGPGNVAIQSGFVA
jgi:hypothetical protein